MRQGLLILVACGPRRLYASPDSRVDCDQHLIAINPAHLVVKPDAAKTP